MNKTPHLSSKFTTTLCSKITRGLMNLITPENTALICVTMMSQWQINLRIEEVYKIMVYGCKSPLIGAFYGSLATNKDLQA